MNTKRDFDSVVHDWLELGPTKLSDRTVLAVRTTIGNTGQRRLWPSLRAAFGGRGRGLSVAVGLAVAIVVVATVGYGLTSNGIQVGATPSPSPSVESGQRLSFRVLPVGDRSPDAAALATVRDLVAQRLTTMGIANPVIVTSAPDRVVITLPAGADAAAIAMFATATGQVTFVPLPPDTYGSATTSGSPTGIVDGQPLPNDPALVPLITGSQFGNANSSTDENGQAAVTIALKSDAARLFADYTSANVGNFFAIVLDGRVISAPSINSPIADGSLTISLGQDADAVTRMNELVAVLRSGPLPFPLQSIDGSP